MWTVSSFPFSFFNKCKFQSGNYLIHFCCCLYLFLILKFCFCGRNLLNLNNFLQVVKMMVAVVVIFGLCWLPYNGYFIVIQMYEEIRLLPYIQQGYLLIYWLAMSNSMYNPIIYCLMNARSDSLFSVSDIHYFL